VFELWGCGVPLEGIDGGRGAVGANEGLKPKEEAPLDDDCGWGIRIMAWVYLQLFPNLHLPSR
jgi:hypothetical protein